MSGKRLRLQAKKKTDICLRVDVDKKKKRKRKEKNATHTSREGDSPDATGAEDVNDDVIGLELAMAKSIFRTVRFWLTVLRRASLSSASLDMVTGSPSAST